MSSSILLTMEHKQSVATRVCQNCHSANLVFHSPSKDAETFSITCPKCNTEAQEMFCATEIFKIVPAQETHGHGAPIVNYNPPLLPLGSKTHSQHEK